MSEIDVNSVLIAITGGLSGFNAYMAKGWKDHTDKKIDELSEKFQKTAERVARMEGKVSNGNIKIEEDI